LPSFNQLNHGANVTNSTRYDWKWFFLRFIDTLKSIGDVLDLSNFFYFFYRWKLSIEFSFPLQIPHVWCWKIIRRFFIANWGSRKQIKRN
jgi:hypothetical protein